MNWHYLENGQQVGPVSEEQFAELARSGKITGETLVWREGLSDWLPYRQVAAGAIPSGATHATCAECGHSFSQGDMIQYGGRWICASCKPVFMQKLAEGAVLNQVDLRPGGLLARFAAYILDAIILYVAFLVMWIVCGFGFNQAVGLHRDYSNGLAIFLMFLQYAIAIGYETFLVGRYGATLGKMACGIRVDTGDGGNVSYLRAFARYFAKIVSGMICLIGYFMIFFDKERRALHDRMCNTRVVLK